MAGIIHPQASVVARATARWVTRLVLLALALLVLAALAIIIVIPRATHGTALTVLSGSMTPTIAVGSIVVVRPVDPGTLHVGDIATYQKAEGKAEFITHRVVKIDDSTSPPQFTFKGDANRGADIDPVSAKQIRGEVWFHVPYLGAIRDGLHGKGGVSLLAMLVLGGYALSQISGAWTDRRREPACTKFDRPIVLAELSTIEAAQRRGLTPIEVADQWHAILLDQSTEAFRLLVVPPSEGLAAAVELLGSLGALSVTVHAPPVTFTSIAPAPDLGSSVGNQGHDRKGAHHART
jgi:signal peptidase I